MCLHELSLIDDTLEALGFSKEYQQLRNWIIQIIIGWIVFIFSILLATVHRWKFIKTLPIYFAPIYQIFVLYCPEFVNILSALICGTILGLVY